jgi:hypothetical protein
MVGQEKTFTHLEPIVIKNLQGLSSRDLSHLMYSFAVRGAGNPALHAAFEKRLE